jgi:ubiquinone/menaquinone biosynthesis C-methylase UbiE
MLKLNLGCGSDIKDKNKGWVNVNYFYHDGVDVVHDLNVFHYPFDDCSADFILLDNVLEHLYNIDMVLKECHRILKNDVVIKIIVPCKKYDTVPIHLHLFDEFSFDGYIKGKNKGMEGTQDKCLFIEDKKIIIRKYINFRFKTLRRIGLKSGINSLTFEKYFNIKVNKDNTFGNFKELEFNLKKI